MLYTKLGKTDIDVSVIGFGAWAIGGWMWGGADQSESIKAVDAAIESGINLIDTAPAYGQGLSEEIVGKAIKGKRDKVILATKCGMVWHVQKGKYFLQYPSGTKVYRYLAPQSIRYEIEQSLSRLGTDYIDLYQTHWQDSTTPIEETMSALMDLKKEGKIRAIGASNASLEQLKKYDMSGQLDVDQEKYSLIDTDVEKELLPWCKKNNVTMLAYSPMGQGLLTGKLSPQREFKGDDLRKNNPRFSPENREKMLSLLESEFAPIADKYDFTLAQLTVSALISQGGVVALCGARNESQVNENAKAGQLAIEQEDQDKIRKAIADSDI